MHTHAAFMERSATSFQLLLSYLVLYIQSKQQRNELPYSLVSNLRILGSLLLPFFRRFLSSFGHGLMMFIDAQLLAAGVADHRRSISASAAVVLNVPRDALSICLARAFACACDLL